MIVLVYCILSLLYYVFVFSPAPCDIFCTAIARCSLFVLKMPLNTDQLTNFTDTF